MLRRGQGLDTALVSATRGLDLPADRALAHAIASETLRHLPDLDALIDSATRNRLADDAKARSVLRLALVQILVLGTPAHAAIATALPLVEGGPRRLVHGVLGTLLRRGAVLPGQPSLPEDVTIRWTRQWGEAMVSSASTAIAQAPPLDVTLRSADDTEGWAERLGGASLAPGHVRLPRGSAIPQLPGFAEGAWWVQNLAASLPARLLGDGEGRTILDLCAAPGGKTLQLAAAGWAVTAVDQDRARLVRLTDNLKRTRLSATTIQADILRWTPPARTTAILLDAPCSATGIFGRHPDVLHRVRPSDIAALAALQTAMISRVADWLLPGGTLIYATCSLEQAEGEAQVAAAETAGLTLDPVAADWSCGPLCADPSGVIRVLPGHGADGFFIARFTRP